MLSWIARPGFGSRPNEHKVECSWLLNFIENESQWITARVNANRVISVDVETIRAMTIVATLPEYYCECRCCCLVDV